MFQNNSWLYIKQDIFKWIKTFFEYNNQKKEQIKRMQMYWPYTNQVIKKMPDTIKHYKEQDNWLVKIPLGLIWWKWSDKIQDQTDYPTIKQPEFIWQLYPEQQAKVNELLQKRVGIMEATTWVGKAQPLYSKVLWENWWIKMWDIKLWDKIFWEDWNIYNIIWLHPQWKMDIYEIIFNDWTSTRCTDQHLWTVQNYNDRNRWKSRKWEKYIPRYRTIELYKIRKNILKYEWLNSERLNYSIDINDPINFSKKELIINPYLLWVYLWDWNSNKSVHIINSEKDIIEKCNTILPEWCKFSIKPKPWSNSFCNSIININFHKNNKNNFIEKLKEIWLFHKLSYEKFIPKEYLYSSLEDRLELLRWLLDTDWYIMKWRYKNSSIEYSTTSKQLSDDIIFLVRSLWWFIYCKKRKSSYLKDWKQKQCLDHYRLHITMPNNITPVSSIKHLNRFTLSNKNFKKYIKEIIYIWKEECQCITVDNPSNLYITDDFTVTHNSVMINNIISNIPYKILVIVPWIQLLNEMTERIEKHLWCIPRTYWWKKQAKKTIVNENIIVATLDSMFKVDTSDIWCILIDEADKSLSSEKRLEFIDNLSPKYLYWFTWTMKINNVHDKIFNIYFGNKTEFIKKHFIPNVFRIRTEFEYSWWYTIDEMKDFAELNNELSLDEERNELIVNTIAKYLPNTEMKKWLVLSNRVEHCYTLSEKLEKLWICTRIIVWDVWKEEREQIKNEVTNTKEPIVLLWSASILWRWFDLKELQSIFITYPTRFDSSVIQACGRIQREAPNKTYSQIFDFVDVRCWVLNNQANSRIKTMKREYGDIKINYIY